MNRHRRIRINTSLSRHVRNIDVPTDMFVTYIHLLMYLAAARRLDREQKKRIQKMLYVFHDSDIRLWFESLGSIINFSGKALVITQSKLAPKVAFITVSMLLLAVSGRLTQCIRKNRYLESTYTTKKCVFS